MNSWNLTGSSLSRYISIIHSSAIAQLQIIFILQEEKIEKEKEKLKRDNLRFIIN